LEIVLAFYLLRPYNKNNVRISVRLCCAYNLLSEERNFFSGMKSKEELGKIIEIANEKATYKDKAKEFLRLIGG
jgi:hypothetical protein